MINHPEIPWRPAVKGNLPAMMTVVLIAWFHFETGSQSVTLGYRDGIRWYNTAEQEEAEPYWTVTHWCNLPQVPEYNLVPEPVAL